MQDGIKFSYCSEAIDNTLSLGIPMISFCDIPLMSCGEHRSKYGLYAIGFSKNSFSNLPNNCEIGSVGYFSKNQKELINILKDLVKRNNTAVGWSKQYQMDRNGKNQINYDECEWRILALKDEKGDPVQWFWSEDDFLKWKDKRHDNFLESTTITFSASDIRYIIVNQEKNIPNVVKRILKLKTIAGKIVNIEDKEILCSRIISFEQLKSDF